MQRAGGPRFIQCALHGIAGEFMQRKPYKNFKKLREIVT